MSGKRFHCDCCGLCCRHIGNIPQLQNFDRGDGVCCHLTDENLCDIYDSRPEVCSVERMYSHFSATMTRNEYEDMMSMSCAVLKKNYGSISFADNPRQASENLSSDLMTVTEHINWVTLSSFAKEVGVVLPMNSGA